MNPDDADRLARLEQQVGFLFRHLRLNPNLTGSDTGQPGFSSPADTFGIPFGEGRPAAFAPPSFSSGPPPVTTGPQVPMPVAGLVPGPQDCPPPVLAAIQRGKLIDAIKIYRELTGLGLKEAKAAVDAWAGKR